MKSIIYFDNAATTFPKPEEVLRTQEEFYREIGGNPGRSGHVLSVKAGEKIEEAREAMAELIGVDDPLQIAFTYNASYALNMAIFGILKEGDRVITSTLEHNSVARPLRFAQQEMGVELEFVNCDSQSGMIDLEDLENKLKKKTRLSVFTHGSNVSGTIQPLKEIGQLTQKNGALLLVDAAQSTGTFPIDVKEMKIDLLAFTGHKGLYGPMGTGGLYVRPGVNVSPIFRGGTGSRSEFDIQPEFMPDKLECGTPNAGGLAGLAAGIRFVIDKGVEQIHAYEVGLVKRLIEGISEIPGLKIVGPLNGERLGVVSFVVENVDVSYIGYHLDEEFNIMSRVGLHCAPWAHKTFGTFPDGTVRFSFSVFNTEEELDYGIRALVEILKK